MKRFCYVLAAFLAISVPPSTGHANPQLHTALGVPADQLNNVLTGVFRTFKNIRWDGIYNFHALIRPEYQRAAARHFLRIPGITERVRDHIAPMVKAKNWHQLNQPYDEITTHVWKYIEHWGGKNAARADYIRQVLKGGQEMTLGRGPGCSSPCSMLRYLRAKAKTGGKSRLAVFARRMGGKFGTFMEWLSSHAAQRILGVHAIASFTQEKINEALFAYQDEMEAIGDAAKAEAYNNNVRILSDAVRWGKWCLRDGLTFGKAMRRVHLNMNKGGKVFQNILRRRVTGVPCPTAVTKPRPVCACKISTSLVGDESKGCSSYAEKHDRKGRNMTFHIVDNVRRHAGWSKPSNWVGGIGKSCDYVRNYFQKYCSTFCR